MFPPSVPASKRKQNSDVRKKLGKKKGEMIVLHYDSSTYVFIFFFFPVYVYITRCICSWWYLVTSGRGWSTSTRTCLFSPIEIFFLLFQPVLWPQAGFQVNDLHNVKTPSSTSSYRIDKGKGTGLYPLYGCVINKTA